LTRTHERRARSVDHGKPERQVQPATALIFTSYEGYEEAAMIEAIQVGLGRMSYGDVDFVSTGLSPVTEFDATFGRSLLQFMKIEFDYSVGQLRMEELRERSVE